MNKKKKRAFWTGHRHIHTLCLIAYDDFYFFHSSCKLFSWVSFTFRAAQNETKNQTQIVWKKNYLFENNTEVQDRTNFGSVTLIYSFLWRNYFITSRFDNSTLKHCTNNFQIHSGSFNQLESNSCSKDLVTNPQKIARLNLSFDGNAKLSRYIETFDYLNSRKTIRSLAFFVWLFRTFF